MSSIDDENGMYANSTIDYRSKTLIRLKIKERIY